MIYKTEDEVRNEAREILGFNEMKKVLNKVRASHNF